MRQLLIVVWAGVVSLTLLAALLRWRYRAAVAVLGMLLILALALAGCGVERGIEASSPVEGALIAQTAHYAGVMVVQARGEITTKATSEQKAQEVVGWWTPGVAWYYRPNVERFIGLVPGECPEAPRCETPDNVTVHELCHSLSPFHDALHWTCSAKYARPTYPRPAAGSVWTGPGFATLGISDLPPGGVQ